MGPGMGALTHLGFIRGSGSCVWGGLGALFCRELSEEKHAGRSGAEQSTQGTF